MQTLPPFPKEAHYMIFFPGSFEDPSLSSYILYNKGHRASSGGRGFP